MNDYNLVLAAIGLLVMALGLASRPLTRSFAPPSLLALLVGIAVGPAGLGWLDPADLGERTTVLEYAARITLAVGLFGVALRIPRAYPRRSWREIGVLLGLGMPIMFALSTLVIWGVLGVPLWWAALLAAAVTPTDPIAASAIVTGGLAEKHLPERMRDAVSFESGGNDGLAYLFLLLPFLMLTRPAGEALSHWLAKTLLWEVLVAAALGLALGWAAAHLLQAAEERDLIESDWRRVYTVALALFAMGLGRLLETDGVLLVFAAGVGFVQVVTSEEREDEEAGQEAMNRFFAVPIFALLGTALPWEGWAALGWRAPLLAVGILLLRRPPMLLLLRPLLPAVRSTREAIFMGWFGPVAVAAVYYASIMEARLGEPLVWHVVSLVVAASVLAHGVTGAALTRRMEAPE